MRVGTITADRGEIPDRPYDVEHGESDGREKGARNGRPFAHGSIGWGYFCILFLAIPAPTRPIANRMIVEGSGTMGGGTYSVPMPSRNA